MLSQPAVSVSQNKLPVDIRRFPWMRRLAADYAFDYERLRDFFAGNPDDPSAWGDALARAQRFERQRDRMADLLAAQQERRQAPAAARAAAADLRDPRAVAIVTGQQAGLFGGPLFTLLKGLTALRLAAAVRDRHGVPTVAVFWIDSEDHDWDEVRACAVLDGDAAPHTVSLADIPGAHAGAVAGIRLDDSIDAALADLQAALPVTEFTSDLVAGLRRAYTPGTGMADAFGRWLETVLGEQGLVVYDAADAAAKPLVADLFAQEAGHPGRTVALAATAGERLEQAGYHAQVMPASGSLALFHLNEGRHAIQVDDDSFVIGERRVPRPDLLTHIRDTPERFSPNVLLRPLVQDTLFPTVCYVAGPSELAYLGQLKAVYDAFGVPMPLIQQRATATIVDSNAMRFLTRSGIEFAALRAQDEAALNELLQAQLPPTVDASVQDALRALDERMAAIAREVTRIDATLEGATHSTLARMQDELKKLNGKIIQAAKRKDETLRRQFHHARAQAFPNGHPQEREIGFVSFLNKYGPSLVPRLLEALPAEMGQHWVVTI